MTPHPRIPAFVAILATTLLGVAALTATGQFRASDAGHMSLPELEKKIVGSHDGGVWLAYGNTLRDLGRFDSAAKAYQRALDFQPELVDARLGLGISLGQCNNKDPFFDYAARLSASYPKLAVDLLGRPELHPLHGDARWDPIYTAAKAQAVD